MKLCIILALCSLAAAVPMTWNDLLGKEFNEFKLKFGKSYATEEEEAFRLGVYASNRQKIDNHNAEAENGEHSYTLKMNQFGDLTHEEFVQMMNGYRNVSGKPREGAPSSFESLSMDDVPKSVDWRKKGYVTPVKNQGQCGSCWAFSATGALEGQHFRKTGKLVSLSEQNLVDCSQKQGNQGCNGGLMDYAFKYIKANKGVDTEKAYPYEAKDGKCRFSKDKIGATDTGFVDIKSGSEDELTKAIAKVGPVSVAIDASAGKFQFYSSGVYYEEACSPTELDHGVLAVGYGTESNGQDYYIVKNSWAETWGADGYILMARNKNNNCGIATEASYPTV